MVMLPLFQVTLFVYGIVILVRRKTKLLRRVTTGGPAIAIGILFVGLVPLTLVFAFSLGLMIGAVGGQEAVYAFVPYAFLLEFGTFILVVVTTFIIARTYGRYPNEFNRPYQATSDDLHIQPEQNQEPIDTTNPYSAPRDDR